MSRWTDFRDQIRLFTLFPGESHEQLRGCMATADLQSNPRFDAISYVWGDPAPRFGIVIDGRLLKIGHNLRTPWSLSATSASRGSSGQMPSASTRTTSVSVGTMST